MLGIVIDLTMGIKILGSFAVLYEGMQFYYATLVTENLFLYIVEVLVDGAIFVTILANNAFLYSQTPSWTPYLRQANYGIIAVEITFSIFSSTLAVYAIWT